MWSSNVALRSSSTDRAAPASADCAMRVARKRPLRSAEQVRKGDRCCVRQVRSSHSSNASTKRTLCGSRSVDLVLHGTSFRCSDVCRCSSVCRCNLVDTASPCGQKMPKAVVDVCTIPFSLVVVS